MLNISSTIRIPLSEFDFTYARSGGPGGQNVNKVNSKAVLRWSVRTTVSLPEAVRSRFMLKYGNRLTVDGELVLSSQKYRDQNRNVEDCLAKLTEMIASVAKPPTPRRATKPTHSSRIKRLESKMADSRKKQHRRRPMADD